MKIKLLVTDDHQLIREGLVKLLSDQEEIRIVGEASDGYDAIKKCSLLKPDIVLMDISMPKMNGIDATRAIQKKQPQVKVIALSMFHEGPYIRNMLQAGAKGYVLKCSSLKQLLEAIQKVYLGNTFFCNEITQKLVEHYLSNEDSHNCNICLSKHELSVMKLLVEGKSTKDIASELFVSVKTIGTHKQNILKKLNLKNIPDLVKYAIKEGVIILD